MERVDSAETTCFPEPPPWLVEALADHADFGCEQEEAQIPTLGFI
jgi:hypothetical protein